MPALRYDVFGRDPADAPTVLLSAGLGGLAGFWTPQMAALSERFHIIAYDHRGTGANAEALPDDYTIGAMAKDVLGILDEAGVARAHVMGHALGALVGIDLALRAPERVAGLVLVNAWDRVSVPTLRCFAARRTLLEASGAEAYVLAQAIFLYPAAWLARNEARVAAEERHAIAHFQGRDNLLKRLDALQAFDARGTLGGIAAPTLVVAARDDVLVPYTCSEALAAAIPGARLVLMPEGGHSCSVTEPAAFNAAVLGFLAEGRPVGA